MPIKFGSGFKALRGEILLLSFKFHLRGFAMLVSILPQQTWSYGDIARQVDFIC